MRPRKTYRSKREIPSFLQRAIKRKCYFCEHNAFVDYKNAEQLKRYITDSGRIIPRRHRGLCAKHQRQMTRAIKRARIMALLPFKVIG